MARIRIKIPKRSNGFVDVKSIMELNPNLKIIKIRKKFNLRK